MKIIILLMIVMSFSHSVMACESKKYNVYYFPLDIDFYVPPSRETIMADSISFEINSCLINDLFGEMYDKKGFELLPEHYNRLRVMIVNKQNNDEIFFTADKVVLSLANKQRYHVDMRLIDAVIEEIVDFAKKQIAVEKWVRVYR